MKRWMKRAILWLALGLSVCGAFGESIAALIANGAVVVDVRTAGEYSADHIEGAVNIPYQEIVAGIAAVAPQKETSLIVYCASGRRSGIAKQLLKKAGYTHVVNGGGLSDMKRVLR